VLAWRISRRSGYRFADKEYALWRDVRPALRVACDLIAATTGRDGTDAAQRLGCNALSRHH
jgi:hypothetical protein